MCWERYLEFDGEAQMEAPDSPARRASQDSPHAVRQQPLSQDVERVITAIEASAAASSARTS